MLRVILICVLTLFSLNSAIARQWNTKLFDCLHQIVMQKEFDDKMLKSRCDSLINVGVEQVDPADLLKFEYDINQYLVKVNRQSDVMKLSIATLPIISEGLSDDTSMIRQYIYLLNQLGMVSKGQGAYNLIFNYYINGYNLARNKAMKEEQAILLNNIGSMYTEIKNYDKAISYFKQAIAINESLKQNERLFINYNNTSAVYAYIKNFDKALEYAFLAMHQLTSPAQDEMKMLMERNICSIYSKKGMHQYAIEKINEVLKFQIQNNQDVYLGDTYRIMGDIYTKLGNEASAIACYNKALDYSAKYNSTSQRVELLKSLSQVLFLSGNTTTAFSYLKESIELKDSLDYQLNNNQAKLLLDLYSIEQKHIEEKRDEQSNALNTAYIWCIILIVIIILFSIALIILWRCKKKVINSSTPNENNSQVEQLENSIKQYEAKILTLSIRQQYDNDFREQLSDDLKQLLLSINPKSTATKAQISGILSEINRYGSNSELNLFNEIFEKIHPLFFENLTKEYGNLTPKELRLCAMLRLGFSSKSIASITFRETRSVESARNRIRKKFNLQQQDDLTNFLMRF